MYRRRLSCTRKGWKPVVGRPRQDKTSGPEYCGPEKPTVGLTFDPMYVQCTLLGVPVTVYSNTNSRIVINKYTIVMYSFHRTHVCISPVDKRSNAVVRIVIPGSFISVLNYTLAVDALYRFNRLLGSFETS